MGEEENTPLQAKMGKRVEKSLVSGHLSEGLFKLLSENFHEKKVGYPRMAFDSLVSGHLCEGLFELLSDSLVLLLLGHQFILQSVHLLLQLLDGLLSELSTSLGLLQLGTQGLDLLLVGLLPLVGLLLSYLQRLEVVGNNPQFLLQLKDLGLSNISSLLGLLQLRLAGGKLLGNLIIVRICGLGLLPSLLQLLLQSSDPLLVLISLALENLLGSLRVISSSGGLVKLGHSGNHLLLGLLHVLELEGGNAQLLGGHVQLGLKLPSLGHQLVHLILSLGGSHLGSLALLLTNVHSVASVVLLHLHSLHLLLDGLHGDDPVAGCQSGKGAAGSRDQSRLPM